MESSEHDQHQDDAASAGGQEEAVQGRPQPQQGEAPPPDEDVARNPEDPRLNDIKGG